MTLIVSAASLKDIRQVTDRLVSSRGKPFDPSSNKNLVIFARDAILTSAYTGTAYVGKLTTDEWIAEQIVGFPLPRGEEGQPVTQVSMGGSPEWLQSGQIALRLKQEFANAVSTGLIPPSLAVSPFEIVFAGWQIVKGRRWRPVLFSVIKARGAQPVRILRAPRHFGRKWNSRIAPRENRRYADAAALNRALSKCGSSEQLERILVETVRRTAEAIPGYVGPDVMSIHLPPPSARLIEIRYMALQDQGDRIAYTPWLIAQRYLEPPQEVVGGGGTLQLGNWRVSYEFAAVPNPPPKGGIVFSSRAQRRPPAP
jgi:hypothetical protein